MNNNDNDILLWARHNETGMFKNHKPVLLAQVNNRPKAHGSFVAARQTFLDVQPLSQQF